MTDFWFWFMLALLAEVFLLMVAAFVVAVAYHWVRRKLGVSDE